MPKRPKVKELSPETTPTKADAGREIVRANVARETYTSPTFVSLYSNDTQVQVSPWDFRLIFGEITDPPTMKSLLVRVKMTGEVRMSPQHAKRLATVLGRQVKRYEETFGEIVQPVED